MSLQRTWPASVIALLFLTAALRIAACRAWSADLNRDPDAYRGLAERLLDGQGFVAPDGRPTAYRPPLYPLLLAAVLPAGQWGIAALQIVLGTATVAIVVAIGRRLGLGRFALLAGLLIALDPLLLRYTPQVMTEVTCTFLAAIVLWASAVVLTKGQTSASSHTAVRRWAFALGVAFGLAVLSRPTFWAFGILAACGMLLLWLRSEVALRDVLKFAACAVLGTTLLIAPWVMRNAFVIGAPIVTTTHGGYTLLLANNPVFWQEVVMSDSRDAWGGGSLDAWQHSLELEMSADGISQSDEIERDRWMRHKAFDNIRRHPQLFLRSVVFRITRFWAIAPASPTSAMIRWSIGMFYAVTQALAFLGLFRLAAEAVRFRRSNASWLPLLALVVSFTAVHAVYWCDGRMRAPCLPAVALLVAKCCSGPWAFGRRPKDVRSLDR
jgi:4-amino-4-deoxy-L-arabinose transferase-like glycosyltransferase